MTTYVHPDDRPSEFDGLLWDATPGVCCAAFQLGACPHTENDDHAEDDYDPETFPAPPVAPRTFASDPAPGADEPF